MKSDREAPAPFHLRNPTLSALVERLHPLSYWAFVHRHPAPTTSEFFFDNRSITARGDARHTDRHRARDRSADAQTRPAAWTWMAIWTRLVAPILSNSRDMWAFTVATDM